MHLLVIITGFLALPFAALAQKFMDTCKNFELESKDNSTLRATCSTAGTIKEQTQITTDLDLNLCIGFSWAKQQLTWEPYGKFDNQCNNIRLDASRYLGKGVWLTAHCWDLSDPSSWVLVIKDLDAGIMNSNGYLACHDWGRGTTVSPSTLESV